MPGERHLNPLGSVHGGWAATLLDSALGCAVQTLLDRVASMSPIPGVHYPPIPGGLDHRPIPAVLVAAD